MLHETVCEVDECPKCKHYPTRYQYCNETGCMDGYIHRHEEDPELFDPDDVELCPMCNGYGVLRWCPKCGHDMNSRKY